jgi:hypothetical protein
MRGKSGERKASDAVLKRAAEVAAEMRREVDETWAAYWRPDRPPTKKRQAKRRARYGR